jgi:23S rRNA-/tRNA-specific pseudouridylate synthase
VSEALTFQVGSDEAGQRVDAFVTSRMREAGQACTRSDVQRWIADERVLVDGRPVAKKTKVEAGDIRA